MANEEHVKRLRAGVADWNEWLRSRRKQPEGGAPPDLRHADLFDANLCHADLRGVDLSRANLSHASLWHADLGKAGLSRAKLSHAYLIEANLREADLSSADLTSADLSQASLRVANLAGARLSSTVLASADLYRARLTHGDLSNARLVETILVDTDLTTVTGLETCEHRGPSLVDFRTLDRSGSLPLAFLRGVGLPDNVIEYLPSLLGQALQYYSCFISYASKDDDFARRLHADLQNNGVRCWFAPHDLPIGAETRSAIDAEIKVRDKLLLILSEHAINSRWVEDEVEAAYEEESRRGQTVLFPIRLDDAVVDTNEAWAAKLRRQRNIGDFRQWKDHDRYQEAFQRVLRDLKAARK